MMTVTEFTKQLKKRSYTAQHMINAIAEVTTFKPYELLEMRDEELEHVYQIKVIEECHN